MVKKARTCSSFVTLCTFKIKSRKWFSASWCGFIVPLKKCLLYKTSVSCSSLFPESRFSSPNPLNPLLNRMKVRTITYRWKHVKHTYMFPHSAVTWPYMTWYLGLKLQSLVIISVFYSAKSKQYSAAFKSVHAYMY